MRESIGTPPDAFVDASESAVKRRGKDRKQKATDQSKEKRKQAKYSTASVDNSISSRAHAHYTNHLFSRHDGKIEVNDVPSNLPTAGIVNSILQEQNTN